MKKVRRSIAAQTVNDLYTMLKTGKLFGYRIVTRTRDFKPGTVLRRKRRDGDSFVTWDFVQAMAMAKQLALLKAIPKKRQRKVVRDFFFGPDKRCGNITRCKANPVTIKQLRKIFNVR